MNFENENIAEANPVCHKLFHSEMDDDLRPHSAPIPCCYIGDYADDDADDDNSPSEEIEEDIDDRSRPLCENDAVESASESYKVDLFQKSFVINARKIFAADRRSLNVDEGIGSELTSVSGYNGSTPPLLTPQTSVDPKANTPDHGCSSNRNGLQNMLENINEIDSGIVGEQIQIHSRQQSADDEFQAEHNSKPKRKSPTSAEGSNSSPDVSSSPIMSTYDWPMTTTEKLMSKYSCKNELTQFTRRMDNIFPLFTSGQRETVLQGLRVTQQVIDEAWAVPQNNSELVGGVCSHLQKSGNLDFLVNLFISGQYDLRLEAGQVLDAYLSEETCAFLLQSGYLKDIMATIIFDCDGKDVDNIRLSLSLLEALFRNGADTCKAVVDFGGLDFLLEICKSHMEAHDNNINHAPKVDTRLHAAVALANLSIYGGFEIHQTMIRKQLPAWLFLLLNNDDMRVKYYACLCLCMMASDKELERDVQNSGTLNLVTVFLKSCRPENLARSDSKYRAGRSFQFLVALSPLLNSTIPEVLALVTFQFAMEAYLRRGSAKIDVLFQVFDELRLVPRIQEIASVPGYDLASKFAAKILTMIGEHVPYKLSQAAPLWSVKDVQYWVRKIGFHEYADSFAKHRVDGDLLLQTKDEHLLNEIGMRSTYERMRFVRELNSLKRSSDYSVVDRTRLDAWLMRLDPEFSAYTYQMLLNGVDRSTLIHLDDHMLRDVCEIENSIHRLKLMYAIKEVKHVEELDLALLRKQVDIFICYRRSTGSQLASLLKVHLQLRGFKVFIDVDRLYAGQFDKSLLMNIRAAKHFILVLTPRALDPCLGDDECKDWVHLEIQTALNANANIVPVQEKGFDWPPTHDLPADIQRIGGYNAIQWVHEYQEACVDKLHRFLTGQAPLPDATAGAATPPVVTV